jgi:hypothetical protein
MARKKAKETGRKTNRKPPEKFLKMPKNSKNPKTAKNKKIAKKPEITSNRNAFDRKTA